MTPRILVCLLLLISGTSSIYSQNDPCDAFFQGANHRFAGRWDEAIVQLTKAIDLKCPEIGRAYHLRGEARWGKKDYAGAWADATAAIPLLDEPALGHRLRGQLASAQADHKTALTEFTKAIELDPEDGDGYLLRGKTQEDLKNMDAAIADYTQVIALFADRIADGYIYRAKAYNKKGDKVKAFADFNKAVAMAPDEALTNTHAAMPIIRIGITARRSLT